jgi:hypothetical protein
MTEWRIMHRKGFSVETNLYPAAQLSVCEPLFLLFFWYLRDENNFNP